MGFQCTRGLQQTAGLADYDNVYATRLEPGLSHMAGEFILSVFKQLLPNPLIQALPLVTVTVREVWRGGKSFIMPSLLIKPSS